MVQVRQSHWHCGLTELPPSPWNSCHHCKLQGSIQHSPFSSALQMFCSSKLSIVFSYCSFLHTSTVEGSRLCKFPNYSFVHNSVSLLKPSIQPSDALKSLIARLVVMHGAFSLSSQSMITILLAVARLHPAANLLFRSWNGDCFRLYHIVDDTFQCLSFLLLQCSMLTGQSPVWQQGQHVSLLASPVGRMSTVLQYRMLSSSLAHSQWWRTHCNHILK